MISNRFLQPNPTIIPDNYEGNIMDTFVLELFIYHWIGQQSYGCLQILGMTMDDLLSLSLVKIRQYPWATPILFTIPIIPSVMVPMMKVVSHPHQITWLQSVIIIILIPYHMHTNTLLLHHYHHDYKVYHPNYVIPSLIDPIQQSNNPNQKNDNNNPPHTPPEIYKRQPHLSAEEYIKSLALVEAAAKSGTSEFTTESKLQILDKLKLNANIQRNLKRQKQQKKHERFFSNMPLQDWRKWSRRLMPIWNGGVLRLRRSKNRRRNGRICPLTRVFEWFEFGWGKEGGEGGGESEKWAR